MRYYDTSCGPMSCIPTRKDHIRDQNHIYIVVQSVLYMVTLTILTCLLYYIV